MSLPTPRVKVYRLSDEGDWLDKGTGHISLEYMEQSDAMGLLILAEDTQKTLLVHKIRPEDQMYQRAEESTIITWHDFELNSDVAISFQEQIGCEHIWNQIVQVQAEVQKRSSEGPKLEKHESQPSGEYLYLDDKSMDLPWPELSNIEEISRILNTASPFQRDRLVTAILKPNWIPRLIDVFKQAEDLDDTQTLGHMFGAVKGAIMLNDAAVLEELLKDQYVMDVVGALEYDPELKTPQPHRNFLNTNVAFKEVVPIKDPSILAKIHQTYRTQYIKDVILPRALDDATYATLSSLTLFNNVEVVSALASDPNFLKQLFLSLEAASSSDPEWADLVAFLQEFCNLSRHLQQSSRQQLFTKLVQLGLFEQVTRILKVGNESTKLKATDVLLSIIQHDTPALRSFLLQQQDHIMFALLIREFTEGAGDSGLPEQIADLLKQLLDPDTMDSSVEKNEFLDVFYDRFLGRLLDVLVHDKGTNPRDGTRTVPAPTIGLVVDLMCFLVLHHSFRCKYWALRNQLVPKVMCVLRRKERWLVCAGIRFFRTMLSIKGDIEFYTRIILKNNLFEPVMTVFMENGNRYNLLNSAVLELVEYIRRSNIKPLIEHLATNYSHRFADIDYVDTFKMLRVKYEQMQDAGAELEEATRARSDSSAEPPLRGATFAFGLDGEPLSTTGRASTVEAMGVLRRKRRDDRDLEKSEEDYFESDDNEGSGAEPSHADAGAQPSSDLGNRFTRASRSRSPPDVGAPSENARARSGSGSPAAAASGSNTSASASTAAGRGGSGGGSDEERKGGAG